MALLHEAVAMGYRSPDPFGTEDALDPLRGRDDFRLLMMDLEFPSDPSRRTRMATVDGLRREARPHR